MTLPDNGPRIADTVRAIAPVVQAEESLTSPCRTAGHAFAGPDGVVPFPGGSELGLPRLRRAGRGVHRGDAGAVMLRPFPFDGPSVRAVVTTREGGTSSGVYGSLNLGDHVGDDPAAVLRNRDLVAAALGVPALTVADQQHGARVAVVTAELAGLGHSGVASSREHFPATDALVTDVPGVALAILVADCAPVPSGTLRTAPRVPRTRADRASYEACSRRRSPGCARVRQQPGGPGRGRGAVRRL